MDEQEHSATPEPPERPEAPTSPQPAVTPPVAAPAAEQPEPRRRGGAVRKALTSRGAGWVVATAMTGAVVALAVVLATAPPSVFAQRVGAVRSITLGPAFGGPVCVQVPAKTLTPAQIKGQGPVTSWVLVPAATDWVFVSGGAVHARISANGAVPARRLAPGCLRALPRFFPAPAPAASTQPASPSASPSAS
jgi:hypothetical protein